MVRSLRIAALVWLAGCAGGGRAPAASPGKPDPAPAVEAPATGGAADARPAPPAAPAPSMAAPDAGAPPSEPPRSSPPADAARAAGDGGAFDALPATDAKPLRTLPTPNGPLCFGADCDGTNPFPGDMDRIRLYNRPLRPEEVMAHAQRKYEPCAGNGSCVGEWTFDEPMVDGAFRSTGDLALPAMVVGQVAVVDGPDGKSLRLAGKGHLAIANHPSLAFGRALTFEAWVRRTSCPADFPGPVQCRFMRMIDVSGSFQIEHHAGGQTMRTSASGCIGDPWSPTNAWTHVAFTYDAPRGEFHFYVAGKASTRQQRWN